MRFEGLVLGSSASRARFFPFSPDRSVSHLAVFDKRFSVPAVTAFEKLRPGGRALLVPPMVDWGVGDSGWVVGGLFVVVVALGVTRASTSISSACSTSRS